LAPTCHACNAPKVAQIYEFDETIGFCVDCLVARRFRQGIRGVIILVLVWLAVGLYIPSVLARPELNGYWQSANILPALVIGLFISMFVFHSAWYYLSSSGLQEIGEAWAVDAAAELRNPE